MPRCNQCEKFVSLEFGDVELDGEEIDNEEGNGKVTGEIKISLVCAECSQEIKSASLNVDETLEIKHKDDCKGAESELELDFEPAMFDGWDKKGRHLYGAEGTITVTCMSCKSVTTEEYSESLTYSAMDDAQ